MNIRTKLSRYSTSTGLADSAVEAAKKAGYGEATQTAFRSPKQRSLTHIPLALAFAILTFTASLIPIRAEAETSWTAYTFVPSEKVGSVKGLKKIIEAIEKETDGEIKFKLHLGGSLPIKSTNITQALGEGIVQFGDDGFFQGNVPIAGILRLPLLLNTRAEYDKALEVMRPYMEDAFSKQGVVVLGHYLFPLQVAWSTKELKSLSDFEGQKMRVSSPEQAAFVERFGGVPITLGASEVPPALQRGTIDGVFTASAGGGKIWGDMLSHNYRLGVNYFNVVYLVNKEAFQKLSPELQQKVKDVVARLAPTATDLMAGEEQSTTNELKKAGMKVTNPSPEELEAAIERIQPYWDEWAADQGPEATEALKKVREALRR